MNSTTVVSIQQPFDFYVGPPTKQASHVNVREGSSWAAGYIRHGGAQDWRDVQAWRYFENVLHRLLTDERAREEAKMMQGKRLGARGEQGTRCAEILATIIDESDVLEDLSSESPDDRADWYAGYLVAVKEGRPNQGVSGAWQNGYGAGAEFCDRRCEICGVPENFEDLGPADDTRHV